MVWIMYGCFHVICIVIITCSLFFSCNWIFNQLKSIKLKLRLNVFLFFVFVGFVLN